MLTIKPALYWVGFFYIKTMILVINLFQEKSEGNKIYRAKSKIGHFTKEREDYLIQKGYALRIVQKKEKVERKPKRNKKEI